MAKIFKKSSRKILLLTALAVGLSSLAPTYLRAENIDEKTSNLEVDKIQEQEDVKSSEEQEDVKSSEEQEDVKSSEEQEDVKSSEEQEDVKSSEEQEDVKNSQKVYFEDDNLRKYIVDLLNDSSYCIEGAKFSENSEVYKPKMEDLKLLQKFDGLGKSQIDLGEVKSFKGLENAINIKEIRIFTSNLRDLSFIYNMNDLETLYLSSNNIYSIDPISKLSNLRTLSIHSKNLNNYDPISKLGSLEELDITDVSLKNIGFLSNLGNLKSLTLYSNEIESIKDLKDLSKLEELIINNNKIENLEGIENLKKLKKLILSYNNLTDIKGIENLTELEYFEVEKNKVISVKELENLRKLKHVTIRGNLVVDASPFSKLLNLEYLHLYENQIEDISMLQNLSKLREFNFSKNKVSDASVVSNYKELVNLHARENLITNIDFLIPLINEGNLDTVNISENPIIDLTVLSKIDDSKIKEKKTGIVIDKQKINIKLDKSNINNTNGKCFIELENPIKLPDGTYGKLLKETADFDFEYSTNELKDDRLIINLGDRFDSSSEIALYASFSFPKIVPGFSEDWEWTENGPEKVISYGCNFDGDVFFTEESSNHIIDKDKYQEVNFKNDEFRKYIVTSLNNGEFRYFGNPFNENPNNYVPLVYNMRALRTLDWNETSGIDYSKIKNLSGLEYSLFLENLDISTGYVEDISSIKNLRKLMNLNIANNPISSIDILSNFRNLTYVDLSNTKVTDLSPLEKLPNLFAINASGCNIENFGNISEFVEIEGVDRPKDDNSSDKDKDTSKEDKDKDISKEDKDKDISKEDKDKDTSKEDKDKDTSKEDKDKDISKEDKDKDTRKEDKDRDTKKENKKDRDYIKDYTFKVGKPMSDLGNYYGKDAIVRLQEKGILKGFSDGTFRPNNPMTRAELAVVLNRTFKLDKKELNLEFEDIDQSWYEEAIEILSSNNIIFGSKGSFRPNRNITREEMLTMFMRCIDKFETVPVKEKLQFKDVDEISDWAYPYLEKAYNLNLIKGSKNYILPRNHITRGEVALILDKFLD